MDMRLGHCWRRRSTDCRHSEYGYGQDKRRFGGEKWSTPVMLTRIQVASQGQGLEEIDQGQ